MWLKRNLWIMAMFAVISVTAQQREAQLEYVARYLDLAVQEMVRSGVPVSIKLGQGILESRWGTTDLAVIAHNHFGIKCGGGWAGPTYYKEDDEYDSKGRLIPSCFREYDSAESSYVAHSAFLRDSTKADRYGFLFALNPQDYKGWARGLRKAGYATDRDYHHKLIRIIESLELHQYDREVIAALASGVYKSTGRIRLPNESVVLAPLPMKWLRRIRTAPVHPVWADKTPYPITALWSYNAMTDHPARVLPNRIKQDTLPLRRAYNGSLVWHRVRPNELMADISRQYGIRLDLLYKRNQLPEQSEVASGVLIKLQGGRVDKPPTLRPDSPVEWVSTHSGFSHTSTGSKADPFSRPSGYQKSTTVYQSASTAVLPIGITRYEAETRQEATSPGSAVAFKYHVVKVGETLWAIARKYQLSVEQLRALNKLKDNLIVPGIALRVQ